MHALILANGDHPPLALIQEIRRESDLFIATDGAANALFDAGEMPDLILGDFDSVYQHVTERLPSERFVEALDQEASDLHKAISHALEKGADRITILGAGGGRIDHTLTAASLLLQLPPTVDALLRYESSSVRLVRDRCVIEGSPGDTLSLVVFAEAEGVCLEGVEWPLRDESLLPGSRGVSNRLVQKTATLTIRSGWALVCHLW